MLTCAKFGAGDACSDHIVKVPKGAAGDLEPRKQLRDRLDCKSFKWYLENVYPENEIVDPVRDVLAIGTFKNRGNGGKKCIDTLGKLNFGNSIGSYGCNKGGNQNFVLLRNQHIMPLNKMEICLNNKLVWARCGTIAGRKQPEEHMKWEYDQVSGRVRELEGLNCLAMAADGKMSVEACCSGAVPCLEQQWDLPSYQQTIDGFKQKA